MRYRAGIRYGHTVKSSVPLKGEGTLHNCRSQLDHHPCFVVCILCNCVAVSILGPGGFDWPIRRAWDYSVGVQALSLFPVLVQVAISEYIFHLGSSRP